MWKHRVKEKINQRSNCRKPYFRIIFNSKYNNSIISVRAVGLDTNVKNI